MKKILLLFVMLLTVAAAGFADDRVFKKYPGNMRISTFYVSPTALRLGMSVDNSVLLKSLKKLMKKPESIEILNTISYDSHSTLSKDCKEVARQLDMELILNSSNINAIEKTNIYIGKILNDDEIQDIMIESQHGPEYNIVFIRGIIDAAELMKMCNSESQKTSKIPAEVIVPLKVERTGVIAKQQDNVFVIPDR